VDYVEIDFDGPILRCLTYPSIRAEHSAVTFPNPGSRDALCSLIGKEVEHVHIQKDDVIALDFGASLSLRVPLDAKSRQMRGPEAANFIVAASHIFHAW
jgi:hypothetical protein